MFISLMRKWKVWFNTGRQVMTDPYLMKARALHEAAILKSNGRAEIINFIIEKASLQSYLEIGVRNPDDNFNLIRCAEKISVDPGIEFESNPVRFKMTSDEFFDGLRNGLLELDRAVRFDLIFIDGLHLADQAARDISNALDFISDKGFIVVHDCNPPTEFHARENFDFHTSPASHFWNGTTWKAFYKYRYAEGLSSVCIDADWGVGVITRLDLFDRLAENENPFYEFSLFESNRVRALNLLPFDEFKRIMEEKYR